MSIGKTRTGVSGKVFGHSAYGVSGGARWEDNNDPVPRDEDGNAQPDENHPCPQCGKLPGPSGHDPCIDNLEGVSFACCGHGDVSQAYVAFDEDEFGDRRVIRNKEAIEYFRLAK